MDLDFEVAFLPKSSLLSVFARSWDNNKAFCFVFVSQHSAVLYASGLIQEMHIYLYI